MAAGTNPSRDQEPHLTIWRMEGDACTPTLTPIATKRGSRPIENKGFLAILLHPMDELAAMEFLLDKMKSIKCNDEFFSSMKH